MKIAESYILQLQHESISTIKCLERIPFDKFSWQPHEKSMTLGQLAMHIANLVGYVGMLIDTEEMDLANRQNNAPAINSTEELVALLKKNVAQSIAKLQTVSDEKMRENWTLRNGDQVIFSMPRLAAIRSMAISHLIHHRGQLSVYLRMLDIPVPSIYGPSADEAA